MAFGIYGKSLSRPGTSSNDLYLDQNKDGEINRKDMIKIIEAMYDLANEEDRSGEKTPDKRVDLIMHRLSKAKDGKRVCHSFSSIGNDSLSIIRCCSSRRIYSRLSSR